MRVLITGISGFIGAATAKACVDEGLEVVGMVRPSSDQSRFEAIKDKIKLVEGDLTDLPDLTDLKADLCIHHAWYAEPGKYPHAIENVASLNGTTQLVMRLAEAGCQRFAGIGTCFEYDFDQGWMHESSPTKPATIYAASKAAMSTLLPQLGEKAGIATTWARLFYQYGPFEDKRRLVASVINSMLAGDKVETTLGEQIRDFSHVWDVGTAIRDVATAGLDGTVNICSGKAVTVRHIIETIGTKLGRLELAEFGARPYNPTDPPFVVGDNSRLKTETSWKPAFDLASGLDHAIEWWKSQ